MDEKSTSSVTAGEKSKRVRKKPPPLAPNIAVCTETTTTLTESKAPQVTSNISVQQLNSETPSQAPSNSQSLGTLEVKIESNQEDSSQSKSGSKQSQSDLKQELSPEKLKKNEIQRVKIVDEILSTEESFVNQLLTLDILYIKPMTGRGGKAGSILPLATCNTLFSNVTSIMHTNKDFLVKLKKEQKKAPKEQEFGMLFKDFAEMLKLYRDYGKKNVIAMHKITNLLSKSGNTAFKDFHAKNVSDPRSKGLSLNGLLITPIQRVPRYIMLLDAVRKVTLNTHNDYQNLTEAIVVIKEAAAEINEGVRTQENREQLIELQAEVIGATLERHDRHFIMQDVLHKVCRSANKPFTFYLFNDMMMYGVKQNSGKVKISHTIPIDAQFIVTKIDTELDKNKGKPQYSWEVINGVKSFVMFAKDEKQFDLWFNKMKKASEENDKAVTPGTGVVRPVWKTDNEVTGCVICHSKFTTFHRRHHCRICGEVVCGDCSKGRYDTSENSTGKMVRACDRCLRKKELEKNKRPPEQKNPKSLHEGYLLKKSRHHKGWNIRYCILVDNELIYYKDKDATGKLGEVNLTEGDSHGIWKDYKDKDAPKDGNEKRNRTASGSFTARGSYTPNWATSRNSNDKTISGMVSESVSEPLKRDSHLEEPKTNPSLNASISSASMLNLTDVSMQACWRICIKTKKGVKPYVFAAQSEEERDIWFKKINERKELTFLGNDGKKDSSSIKEGYLSKQGGKGKKWQVRYFVLTLHAMKYYKEITDKVPAGVIELMKGVSLKKEPSEKFLFSITPKDSKRTYLLLGKNDKEVEEWMESIRCRLHLAKEIEKNEQKVENKPTV